MINLKPFFSKLFFYKPFIAANLLLCILCAACQSTKSNHTGKKIIWSPSSFLSSENPNTKTQGHPNLIDSPLGKAVYFNGNGDRFLIDGNPLENATEFTIEIIFKAADVFPNNIEPRIFHIESPDNPKRRITIELRLNEQHQWYLDTYIKSELSQLTLIDPQKVHPTNQWAHAAITYKHGIFTSYVNGQKELTGEVDYLPLALTAKTSIAARMNEIHWFNGEIFKIAVTQSALTSADFNIITDLKNTLKQKKSLN